MESLKPCPFCNGSGKISKRIIRLYGYNYISGKRKSKEGVQVICQRCHARGPLYSAIIIKPEEKYLRAIKLLEERAALAWNRRIDDGSAARNDREDQNLPNMEEPEARQ